MKFNVQRFSCIAKHKIDRWEAASCLALASQPGSGLYICTHAAHIIPERYFCFLSLRSSFLTFSCPLHHTNSCLLKCMHVPCPWCRIVSIFINNHAHSHIFFLFFFLSRSLKFSDNGPTLVTCKSAKFPFNTAISAWVHSTAIYAVFKNYI